MSQFLWNKQKITTAAGIIAVIILIDQWTKTWALALTKPITIIHGVMDLSFVRNTGAVWGFFSGNNTILLIISIIVLAALLVFAQSIAHDWWSLSALSLIAAGAVGNIIDRLQHGFVIDFIDFHFWPVFNIADSAICIGVGILLTMAVRDEYRGMTRKKGKKGEEKEKKKAAKEEKEQKKSRKPAQIDNAAKTQRKKDIVNAQA